MTGTTAWIAGALVIFAAHFVYGLAGFGVGLVAMALLPFLMAPATAVVLLTVYAMVFALVIVAPLRRDVRVRPVVILLVGSVIGTPLGVWILAALPATVLNRVIGALLVVVVALEFRGAFPARLPGLRWQVGAGVLAGVLGGAVGLPGPPIIVYGARQDWSPRTLKANLQAFFVVNQAVILLGYWWAGLLTRDVLRLAGVYAVPATLGVLAGMALFNRIDAVKFRRIVFTLLFVSGVALLVRG